MLDKDVSALPNKHKDAPVHQLGAGRRLQQTYLEWDWRTKGVVRTGMHRARCRGEGVVVRLVVSPAECPGFTIGACPA